MFAAILVAMVLILAGQKEMAKGLILGTLFSVINFVLMSETLQYRLGHNRSRNTFVALLLIVIRFGLLAVPLIASIHFDQVHIVTTIIGIFMVQLAIPMEVVKGFLISKLSTITTGK